MPGQDRHQVFRLTHKPHKLRRRRCGVCDAAGNPELGRPVWIGHHARVAVHRLHNGAAQGWQTDWNAGEQDCRQVRRQRLAHQLQLVRLDLEIELSRATNCSPPVRGVRRRLALR